MEMKLLLAVINSQKMVIIIKILIVPLFWLNFDDVAVTLYFIVLSSTFFGNVSCFIPNFINIECQPPFV